MDHAFICDATRTPFGRYGGALSGVRTDDLAATPMKALITRNPSVDWEAVDDVLYGCVNQAGEDNRNVARMAVLLAGLPERTPGATVNRLCGSGLEALGQTARAIRTGEAALALSGGVECMSRAPMVMPKADAAFSRRAEIYDTTIGWRFVNPEIKRRFGVDEMPVTAENLAEERQISRADQDAYALRSQERAAAAIAAGRIAPELTPVTVRTRKGETLVEGDEHPRATSLDKLAALPTPFRADGSVTAGNASGVNDGAAAMILANEAAAAKHGLEPKARVVAMTHAGVAPRIMGIGPAPATRRLLERLGLALDAIDVIELNEAFAAQALAVTRDLGLPDDDERVNPNGGAIAFGHPLGASGARIAMTAVNELGRRRGRYALCTMCIGVGQGIALLLERV